MRRLAARVFVDLLVLLFFWGQATAAPFFTITEIAPLADDSRANAINNAGQVVGEFTVSGVRRAFRWENGTLTDLGLLPGTTVSIANGINDPGQVVGASQGSPSARAFLWDKGTMTEAGDVSGTQFSTAFAINQSSQIVGDGLAGGFTRAFLWDRGTRTDLGTLGGTSATGQGINERGHIVGTAQTATPGVEHAYLWEDGMMTDLGVLPGGEDSFGVDINNAGQVVGTSNTGLMFGRFSPNHTFLWDNGVMTDLGCLSLTTSCNAFAINQRGQIVGQDKPRGQQPRAVIWQNGTIFDLNMLIPDLGWELHSAFDINDSGQIVGYGFNPDGFNRGFLLTPIPEPFADFDIERVRVGLDGGSSGDRFEVRGSFVLGDKSDGIDVLNEDVTVTFDGFTETIPAGSFFRDNDDEGFEFEGVSGGIEKIEIRDDGEFRVKARDLALSAIDITNPVPFALQIGDDIGQTEILFDDEGRFRQKD